MFMMNNTLQYVTLLFAYQLLITASERDHSIMISTKLWRDISVAWLVYVADHREWPGFDQPIMNKYEESIWERSSPSPPQSWTGFLPAVGSQQPYANKGPSHQQQQPIASMWGHSSMASGWNPGVMSGSFDSWSRDATSGIGVAPDYGVDEATSGATSMFDVFSSPEMSRIWNSAGSDSSSGVSGWSLGKPTQRSDPN